MKKRQRVLTCGRVIYFKETTPRDIGLKKSMKKRLLANRKLLESLVPFENAGRRNNEWVSRVYNKFTTVLTELLVERLLSGDRIETLDGHVWMIASIGESKRHVNWHTDGHSYAVEIKGLKGNFGITLSRKMKAELRKRITSGQNYHIIDGRIQ
jgi:hypothetical protein